MWGGEKVHQTNRNASTHSHTSPATCHPIFQRKRHRRRQIEDGCVCPEHVISPNAGVGIIQCGDQGQSRRDADCSGRQQAVPLSQAELYRRKKEHRKKQQLHVFPYGFIHSAEHPRQQRSAAPLVHEVGQGAQHRRRKKTRQGPEPPPSPHNDLPPSKIKAQHLAVLPFYVVCPVFMRKQPVPESCTAPCPRQWRTARSASTDAVLPRRRRPAVPVRHGSRRARRRF